MHERHVTAIVLLDGTSTHASATALLDALAAQTQLPQRIAMVVPEPQREQLSGLLDDAADRGLLDSLIPISSAVSRSGAVREVLASLRSEADAAPSGSVAAAEPAVAAAQGSRGGRRARDVNTDQVERARTQQAEDLARVPERLRENRPRTGRRAATTSDETWLWFLQDGSPPEPDALEQQLRIVAVSPNTAVVGAKRVRPLSEEEPAGSTGRTEAARALVDVGLTLTRSGGIVTGIDPGEIDQGQSDWRQDVLAVPLPGMLVRENTLRDVGPLDPDLPPPWAEIDLCRRIWRSGERVAVQSAARVQHRMPTRPRLERLREQRMGQILLLLKHRPPLYSLLTLLLLPLLTLVRIGGALAAVAPRLALMELSAWGAAMSRAGRVMRRGRQDARRARVPQARLAPLYLPRGEDMRRWAEETWTGLVADDDRQRRIRRTTWGIAGTRHGIDDADYGRHIAWTAVVALSATALAMVALRGLFGRGELTGPALRRIPETWGTRWEAAWASWIPGGLGERGPADALVRLLGHLPLSGSLALEALVFTAIPLSALLAWWAAGAITRAVGARLVLAVAWGLAPPLLSALMLGAWPLLLVHLLLPPLALAVGRAVGLPHKVSQASVSAAAAGGLVLLVIGAVQPVLVLIVALALGLVAIAVPGRRRRLLWVLLPSLALHAPYVPLWVGHPELLLAVAGVPPSAATPTLLDLLALWPVPSPLPGALAGPVGPTAALLLALVPLAPVALAALGAPLLAGAAGRMGRFSLLAAAIVVLAVLLAQRTPVAVGDGQLVTAPLHGLLSVLLLALALGAGATFDALARREQSDSRSRRITTSALGAMVAAVCVVSVAGWTMLLPAQLQIQRSEQGEVPAAAADQGRSDARSRVLVLDQRPDGSVEADLVVHGGDSVIQHATVADLRTANAARAGQGVDDDAASAALREAVGAMLAGGGSAVPDAEEQPVAEHLAISYVIVPGHPQEQAEVSRTLDASPLLEKVTDGARGGMWRLIGAQPRAEVIGPDGESIALASGVVDARGDVPAADVERTVLLSERFDGQWRASVDGRELAPLEVDGWAQGFTLPAGLGGEVVIQREQPALLAWQILLYSVTALTALIAIPWRVRPRTVEEMYG